MNTEQTFTWEQVAQNSTAESLWIVIENRVYNVTEFQKTHPGTAKPFLHYAGKDATIGFTKMHAGNDQIKQYMVSFCIGTVST
jgi:cytochrome b involved in lipid metabolism